MTTPFADRAQPPRLSRFGALPHTLCGVLLYVLFSAAAYAHGVADGDKGYIQEISGTHLLPFTYLGAKHMVTGYDHLLFLAGVIFFLYKLKDIALYVSLFAIGHSVTMLYGVYAGVNVNPYLIDAIIGLSVVYKALDNLGAYQRWFGVQPNDTHGDPVNAPKGFYHGYGKGRNETAQTGTLQAAFDGKHGWFWRNRSSSEVTVTLKTRGEYGQIERVL